MKTNSKKLFALIMSVIMLMGIVPAGILSASAAETINSGYFGENLKWFLDDEGTLAIIGGGEMKNCEVLEAEAPWYPLKNSIKNVNISDRVTSIGSDVFAFCENLESITIPDSVTRIGDGAFRYCTNLKTVTFGKNSQLKNIDKEAFGYCISLENLAIPNCAETIGTRAFASTGLKEVVVPDSVISIGDLAFSFCPALEYIHIPSSVIEIGGMLCYFEDEAFEMLVYKFAEGGEISEEKAQELLSIEHPETYICSDTDDCFAKEYAENYSTIYPDYDEYNIGFVMCSGHNNGTCGDNLTWTLDKDGTLTISGIGEMYNFEDYSSPWSDYSQKINEVIIENDVTSIGDYAFVRCTNFASIIIPESVTSIGKDAFSQCGLKDIIIPDSVESIGSYAFAYCYDLTNVTLGNGIKIMGEAVFFNCRALKSINIPNNFTCIYENMLSGCSSLTSVIIPNGVTRIKKGAFSGCFSLTDVNIPYGVTTIEKGAFYGCLSLENIVIPESVESIGDSAFAITGLKKVIIPNSVTSIGDVAFGLCPALEFVHIPSSVTTIGGLLLYYSDENLEGLIREAVEYGDLSEQIANEILSIKHTDAYICSCSDNCYAKEYAEKYAEIAKQNGLEAKEIVFKTCTGHVEKHNDKSDVTAIFDTNTFAEDVDLIVEGIKLEDKRFGSYKVNANDTQYGLFEIHMINSKDEYIQPQSGKVTLKIPIPAGIKASDYNSLYVVHIKQNKEPEKFTYKNGEVRIEGKYLVFEIESFSTFVICTEAKNSSVSDIVINVAAATSVDYRSKVTIKATATGVPSNSYLAIYVNGKQVAKGNNKEVSYMLGEAKSDVNYTVKVVDAKGTVQKDANNKDLAKDSKVTVNSSFFAKIIAFFRGLFGLIKVIEIKP